MSKNITEQRKTLFDAYFRKKKEKPRNENSLGSAKSNVEHKCSIAFPGSVVAGVIGDYGVDHSATSLVALWSTILTIPKTLFDRIKYAGAPCTFTPFNQPVQLRAAIKLPKHVALSAIGMIRASIKVSIPCGILSLRNVDL